MPTLDTVVSRLELVHPDLAHDGGSGLHTKIRNGWRRIGDHMNSRYFETDALADTASQDYDHNFKTAFSDLQPLLYSRVVGTGELTLLTGATSPSINDFTIEATPGNLTTQMRVTNNSGGPQDISLVIIQNGGGSAGGGGGGAGFTWNEPDGDAPIKSEENGELVYLFEPGSANRLVASVKVPESHLAGSAINIKAALYSPSTSNTILLGSVSTLIRKDTDAVSSTTNQHTSTNTALTNTVADQYRETTIDLTDGSGQINGITVLGGDLIRVELSRGSDTDTDDIRFLPSATEVS